MNELKVPKRIPVVSLLVLLPVFTAFSVPSVSAQDAIDFTLKDISGTSYTLSDYFGEKTVLINFWATWCQPCVKELQHLQETQDKYGNDLLILAVSVDGPGTRSQVPAFVERYNFTFPVLLDTDSRVLTLYDPQAILPYTVLINRNGGIEYVHKGYSPGDEVVLDGKISEALQVEHQAREGRISYNLNEAFIYRSFSDRSYVDKYREGRASEVLNQTDITVTASDYIVGIRFDSNLDYSPLEDRHILGNRFLEINRNGVNLRFGDFYHVVGKGLSLSVTKQFEQEGLEHTLESSIRGTRLSLDRDRYSLQFFGGRIRSADSENDDDLWGGTAGLKLGNSVGLHLTYLDADIVTGLSTEKDDYSIQTLGLDLPHFAGIARASGEVSLLQNRSPSTDETVRGHAIYLESGLDLGDVSVQVEFKDYDHFDFKYSHPPSLESEDLDIIATQFNTEVIDISGAAGRIDYRPGGGSALIFGKLSFFSDTPEDHPLWGAYKREISHYMTGLEKYFGDTGYVNMLAGYRVEDASSPLLFFSDTSTWHYQINAFHTFSPGLSLEADWKSKRVKSEIYNFYEDRAFLALHWVSRGIVTLFYERSNDPELMLVSNKTEWWAGQIEVKLSSSNSISAMLGSTKGGVKCSGGVCRAFPPFEGFRLEMIFRL